MSPAGPLLLGLDAGGTGCRARLADAEGRVLGEGRAGPASLRLGADAAFAALMAASGAALAAAGLDPAGDGSCVTACAGIAGHSRREARAALEARAHPFAALRLMPDIETACIGAHGGAAGGIVVVGTGSCAFGRSGGRTVRFGGWGLPASDEGSGAFIGLRAVEQIFRHLDGRAPASHLTDALSTVLPDEPAALVSWIDAAGATGLAGLAPHVLDAAKSGDAAAEAILAEAGRAIGQLAAALNEFGIARVALVGGLAAALAPRLSQDLVPPLGDALDGALFLARADAGLTPR